MATLRDAGPSSPAFLDAAFTVLSVRVSGGAADPVCLRDRGAPIGGLMSAPLASLVAAAPRQRYWPQMQALDTVGPLRRRSAVILTPRANAERPAEVVAALALEVTVTAAVDGCPNEADRARIAVAVWLPNQTQQLEWPRPEQWTPPLPPLAANQLAAPPPQAPWHLAMAVYIVQPTWTDAATVRLEVVYVPETAPPVALSPAVFYSVVPKPVPL